MTRRCLCVWVYMLLIAAVAMPAAAQVEGAATPVRRLDKSALPPDLAKGLSLWEDFIHYLRVAQTDLAISSAQALLDRPLSAEQLLSIVEDLSIYRDYQPELRRAQNRQGPVGEMAMRVADRLDQARLELARDRSRVRQSIEALDDGMRPRKNATDRLKRGGEHAAPAMLAVLLSRESQDQVLRPFVIEAMEAVGKPIVGPLCEALGDLPPVPKQQVAEVLARIGYPQALPYLKAELNRSNVDTATQTVLNKAFTQIAERSGVPKEASAAQLFLGLGEDYYYKRGDLVQEPTAPTNLLWSFNLNLGLTSEPVPTAVYHDVMAMRAARRALRQNPSLSRALSLWLAANFRRENNLGGAQDPSYGPEMRSPHYYATLSGPSHLHPVLQRALVDTDAELALDAIRALASTSGTKNLLNIEGTLQPLVAAMNYPDRRVRFEAAFTIARSQPHYQFSGAQRVVPVLSEAVRSGERKYAIVLAADEAALSATASMVQAAGDYRALLGGSVENVLEQVAAAPGVDLVVVRLPMGEAMAAVGSVRKHFKMMAAPVLVLAEGEQVIALNRQLGTQQGVFVTNAAAGDEPIASAMAAAIDSVVGEAIDDDQALAYSLTALAILRDLALQAGPEFQALDAKPALIEALRDAREQVVLDAAEVLTRLTPTDAQRALADVAISRDRGEQMQIELLRALAQSARFNGNQLTNYQISQVADLVSNATGELADAASEAHGALNLPTSDAVNRIIK